MAMALALSGLIFLQYHWIKEAIAVKEARFDQTVSEVMDKVVNKMEKLETAEIMLSKASGIRFYNDHIIQFVITDPISVNMDMKTARQLANQKHYDEDCDEAGAMRFVNEKEGDREPENEVFELLKADQNKNKAYLGVYLEAHPNKGVELKKVIENSPAEKAGLKDGDIITAINGREVSSALDVKKALKNFAAGDRVSIAYKRQNQVFTSRNSKNKPGTVPKMETGQIIRKFVMNDTMKEDFDILWETQDFKSTTFATLTNKEKIAFDDYEEEVKREHQSIVLKDVEENVDVNVNLKKKYQGVQTSKLNVDIMQTRMGQVQSLVMEMDFANKTLEERIDPEILESTIDSYVKNAGIDLDYEYCLRSCSRNLSIYTKPCQVSESLYQSPYRTKLYTNEVFSKRGELLLHFPAKDQYLWSSSRVMLGSSLLFNLVIILIFAHTLLTIYRQKKLSDMKTDFINNMTHELKTPISTISLAAQLLSDNSLPKTEKSIERYAQIIREENHRLQNHVEKVLHYARLEKGNLKLDKVKLDVNELINEVIDSQALRMANKNVTITYNLNAHNAVINGNRLHLTNVLSNIIDNAIKYSKDCPEIIISTENTDDNCLMISVEDKGIGMSKDTLKKIFDKFYRVSTGDIHDVKGFGLGLSYVKLMTDVHEGRINVKSKLNKGSTFELYIPLFKEL